MPTAPEVQELPLSQQLRDALDRVAQLENANPNAANAANLTQRVNAAEAEVKSLRTELATAQARVADLAARAAKGDALVADEQRVKDAENRAAAAESRQRVAEGRELSMRRRLYHSQMAVYRNEHARQIAAGASGGDADTAARLVAFPEMAEIEKALGPKCAAESEEGREAAAVVRLVKAPAAVPPAEKSAADATPKSYDEQVAQTKGTPTPAEPKFASYDDEVRARRAR